MLRAIFIYLSKALWARQLVTRWPIAWRIASRFVAGETANDAIRAIRELNAKGIYATLDHLGESITEIDEAQEATREIVTILEEIDRQGVKSGVSIKPSQIGLALDRELYEKNLEIILKKAKSLGNFVRVDMEDSPFTDATIESVEKMRQEGFDGHVGIVIQSYLYRSAKDVYDLMQTAAPVRLCKGAYKEPTEIAFARKSDVDENYDILTEMLISGAQIAGSPSVSADGCTPPIPAIASHDEERINYAKRYAHQVGLPRQALEFQMLYGIRRDLQEQLAGEGYPVRVYVPYGTEWYPYFMRRLAERPANLWFFLTNLIRG